MEHLGPGMEQRIIVVTTVAYLQCPSNTVCELRQVSAWRDKEYHFPDICYMLPFVPCWNNCKDLKEKMSAGIILHMPYNHTHVHIQCKCAYTCGYGTYTVHLPVWFNVGKIARQLIKNNASLGRLFKCQESCIIMHF